MKLCYFAFSAFYFLAAACSPANPTPTLQKTTEPQPEPRPSAPDEIRDHRIEITIHHPGAVQKNIFFTLKDFGDTWQFEDGKTADPDAVKALQHAASQNLIESDTFYGCRSVPQGRQLRLRFKYDDQDFNIFSSSNCSDFAPFNVSMNGKSYVQLSGELGKAIDTLLSDYSTFTSQTTHIKPGFIDFTKPLTDNVEDIQSTPQTSLIDHYKALFINDKTVSDLLASRKLQQETPELEPTLELGCNQSKSPDCTSIIGRATIPLTTKTYYAISLTLTDDKFDAVFPPSFEPALRAFEQPAVRAFLENAPAPIALSWNTSNTCPVQDALAPWFKKEETDKRCDTWTFTSADKVQTIIYYSRLDATWIADKSETHASALKPLTTLKSLPKPTKTFIAALNKPAKHPRNIFLDGNSSIYVFESKSGKTTCTQCPEIK